MILAVLPGIAVSSNGDNNIMADSVIKSCEINGPDCQETNDLRTYAGMIVCGNCYAIEMGLLKQNNTPQAQTERVEISNNKMAIAIEASRAVDNAIQVRTDLFNAATTSIIELKAQIDANPEITNKPYALAEELTRRFEHHKQVVFELSEQIVAAGNNQKAIQVYLNQLANSLRAEEREKLKIADINYKPNPVKPVKTKAVKTTGTSKKLDKSELKKYAAELGVSEFTLQMLCVSKGISPEMAANQLRKSINEAKSET